MLDYNVLRGLEGSNVSEEHGSDHLALKYKAEAVKPEYWVLFTLRWVAVSESSAYKYASCFDKKWRTLRCYDLNNEYYSNVPLQVARPCGWLESPLIVSR